MKRGFTLIETVVTIAVYALVMIAVAEVLRMLFMQATQQPLALNAVDQARATAATFTNEIRDASVGNDGAYPLREASTTQIIFYSPYGNASPTTINRVRYYLASTTLYKGVIVPSGSPLAYNSGNETVTPVMYSVSNGTTSIFTYYDGNFSGTSTPLSQPVNVNQVTYVRISIGTYTQDIRGATSTFTISTGATVRNLKTNLGN